MPAVGPGLVVGQLVARLEANPVRALIMGMAAEVERVVGAEDVRLLRLGLGMRRRLPADLEAAERLEPLLVIGVKPVVGEPNRLHRWRRRRYIGEEIEQAAAGLMSIRGRLNLLHGRH
jgi:hypothetical protein